MRANTVFGVLLWWLAASLLHGEASVIGDWRTIDDSTGKTNSIVRLYLNDEGMLEGISTQPGQWEGGRILDPKNGKVYKARLRLRDEPA